MNITKLITNQNLGRLSIFITVFLIVKTSTFLAPLFLSNLLPSQDEYGLFEYILNLGIILAAPLSIGLHGAYPFYILKKKQLDFRGVFFTQFLFLIVFLLIALGIWCINILPSKYLYACLIAIIYSTQMLLSSINKTHDNILRAVVIEGGLFMFINIFNFILYYGYDLSLEYLIYLLFAYVTLLLSVIIFHKREEIKKFSIRKYTSAIKFGSNLVLSGFLILLLSGSTRVYIEHFLSLSDVSTFSFYFRISAIVVMIHQIVNIAFFKKIYEAKSEILDKYFALFLLFIFLSSIVLFFTIPFLFLNQFDILKETYPEYKPLYFIILFQVNFWICLALNENIIYREELAKKMNLGFIIIILIMLSTFVSFKYSDNLSLNMVVIINTIFLYFSTELQFFFLKKFKNSSFIKTRLLNLFLILLMVISYQFI